MTSALKEDQKKRILAEVQDFTRAASEYIRKEAEFSNYETKIEEERAKLSTVAEEERQVETAMEVLYGEQNRNAETKEIGERIDKLRYRLDVVKDEVDKLRTELLKQMRTLPIPIDLDNPLKDQTGVAFGYFQEARLGEEGIRAMCRLMRQEYPLSFSETVFLPDGVVVKNASDKQEALARLIESIRSYRMLVDALLKSYEQIDEMVERLRKSSLYSRVLTALRNGKLSAGAIAKSLNLDQRKVYDTCYNLTRSNWSPAPIEPTSSGEWKLTLPGEILVNRLLEKESGSNTVADLQTNSGNCQEMNKET